MFLKLLGFEIKVRLFRLSTLVSFLAYCFIGFMLGITFAGAFKGANVSFGLSNKLAVNSPVALNHLISFLGYFGLLVAAPVFGQSIYKDFERGFNQILFATPIRKLSYFASRYFGSVLSSLTILTAIAFGIWLATCMPFIDRSLVSENRIWFYVAPYLTNVLPNLMIFGAIFIAVVARSKSMAPVYFASIVVFTGWLISQSLTSDLDNKTMAAMVEPFGIEAASQIVRYWSIAEQSSRVVPMSGILLSNRLAWGALGLLSLGLAYWMFNPFRDAKSSNRKQREAKAAESVRASSAAVAHRQTQGSRANPSSWKVLVGLTFSEFKQIFSNIYFMMILLCGILYIFAISGQVGKFYGTETWPVTYSVLSFIGGSFGLFIVIMTTYYAGELVWKDRDRYMAEIVDSKPAGNLYLYLSKLSALLMTQILFSLIILFACVVIQTAKGYTNYEWPVYFKQLFFYSLAGRMLLCVLSLFIHSAVPNKPLGHAALIAFYLLLTFLPNWGFEHHLYLVGFIPKAMYSDMNGFGTSLKPFITIGLYWLFFHVALAVVTLLIWRRGNLQGTKATWLEAKRRFRAPHAAVLGSALLLFLALGSYIFYNTNILNRYQTKKQIEQMQVDYERLYKKHEALAQPQLISVQTKVDIFPETQAVHASGTHIYENRSGVPIQRVFVNIDSDLKIDRFEWSRPANLVEENALMDVKIFEFEKVIAPGEKLSLDYASALIPNGFRNGNFPFDVVGNGTFFNGSLFAPVVGYQKQSEIDDNKTRRKYGLENRPRMAGVDDEKARMRTYISDEANWIDFEATVSTSADQVAIAPGYLEKEWQEGDRRYFHYKMDRPILNFYSFNSARYAVAKDEWNDVKIEVYHHPAHTANIPRMIHATKKSLEYFTKAFSPYQFRQFRILEFPRYRTFAQAFPNTIPFSEAIGFIARIRENDPESIDYPFYVTAHELAHQWWAHQIIGGKNQGATMLSESLAQYSALMVQEQEYGPKQMKKFLKYELDRYLYGRSTEELKELPLAYNENQQYIHYNKGSLVFYALKDYLGEELVNGVIRDFVKEHAFKDAPFPRAIDLVERFRAAAPEDMKYLIEDLFETVTFYDNRSMDLSYRPEGKGFKAILKGNSKKLRADELGHEKEIAFDDWIDVGLYDQKGELIYLKKHRLKPGDQSIELLTENEPAKGGIDPLNKLIDRISDDNLIPAEKNP